MEVIITPNDDEVSQISAKGYCWIRDNKRFVEKRIGR